MKILLLGKNGQLGWELHRSLQDLGQVMAYDFPEVDFAAPSSLGPLVKNIQPQLVINAAAYTDVDRAESEVEKAKLINAEAPAILAETCRRIGAALIHYSTDYVFDGKKGAPYSEEDIPRPLNIYGQTKLEGEQAVLQAGGISMMFRTAWVYSMRGDNFVTRIIRWAHNKPEIRIVEDQISNPTWARSLAEITAQLIAKAGINLIPWLSERQGCYHLAGWGFASRLDWANEIVRNDPHASQQLVKVILPAHTKKFATPAVRPLFSALDCKVFEKMFSLRLTDWNIALRLALKTG